jgi:ABC-type phosphate transport system substrate-binding protein
MKKLLYAILLVASASIFAAQANAQAVVIANPSVKSSDVSKSDLRDVFTGAASSFNDEFLASYVGKNEVAFRAGWRSLVFSGQASMPKSFDSDSAVVEYVAHNAGAVGYIGKSSAHDGVKVLAVR